MKPPSKKRRLNYVINIHVKWHQSFFYFIATLRTPGRNAIAPTFELPFTRLEFVGDRHFNLAYMRHTGQWWEIRKKLTLQACLKAIREEPIFHPPETE